MSVPVGMTAVIGGLGRPFVTRRSSATAVPKHGSRGHNDGREKRDWLKRENFPHAAAERAEIRLAIDSE